MRVQLYAYLVCPSVSKRVTGLTFEHDDPCCSSWRAWTDVSSSTVVPHGRTVINVNNAFKLLSEMSGCRRTSRKDSDLERHRFNSHAQRKSDFHDQTCARHPSFDVLIVSGCWGPSPRNDPYIHMAKHSCLALVHMQSTLWEETQIILSTSNTNISLRPLREDFIHYSKIDSFLSGHVKITVHHLFDFLHVLRKSPRHTVKQRQFVGHMRRVKTPSRRVRGVEIQGVMRLQKESFWNCAQLLTEQGRCE